MKQIRLLVAPLILLMLFILLTESIISVNLLRLKNEIARKELLNYELSSNLLKERLNWMLGEANDFQKEIELNIQESNVLNKDGNNDEINMQPLELIGLFAVNTVRLLSFDSLLNLEDTQKKLLLLRYAFYMERIKHFEEAHNKYSELEGFKSLTEEDHSFILLHSAYSLLMQGKLAMARQQLEKNLSTYPESRHVENARILLLIVSQNIADSSNEPDNLKTLALARSFFRAGLYGTALKYFNLYKTKKLRHKDRVLYARCLEETGQTGKAISEYTKIIFSTKNKIIAKNANRRLLMIGSFYEGGAKLVKTAEKIAIEQNDVQVLKTIKKGASFKNKAVIKTLLEDENAMANPEIRGLLTQLKSDMQSIMHESSQAVDKFEKSYSIAVAQKAARLNENNTRTAIDPGKSEVYINGPKKAAKQEPIPTLGITNKRRDPSADQYPEVALLLEQTDGEKLLGTAIQFDGSSFVLSSRFNRVSIHRSKFNSVKIVGPRGKTPRYLKTISSTGTTGEGQMLYLENGSIFILKDNVKSSAGSVARIYLP